MRPTSTRKSFEACTRPGLEGGGDAFRLKRRCEQDATLLKYRLDKFDAMLLVLRSKWRLPGFKELLLSTAGVVLMEHSAKQGRDPYWTDDHVGGGQNRLGAALMLVRDELLREAGKPSGCPYGRRFRFDFD